MYRRDEHVARFEPGQPDKKGCGCGLPLGIAAGCVVMLLLVGGLGVGIVYFVFSLIKSSDVYQDAVARARANTQVVQALGEPIEEWFFVGGSMNTSNGSGSADLHIPISGPNGYGKLHAVATKSGGQWTFTSLRFKGEAAGQNFDLLAGQVDPAVAPSGATRGQDLDFTVGEVTWELAPGEDTRSQDDATNPPDAADCAANLRQLGELLRAAASREPHEYWPALDPTPGRLFFDTTLLSNPEMAICPEQRGALTAADRPSYWYLGYAVRTEQEGLAFVDAYRAAVADGAVPTGNIEVEQGMGTNGGSKLFQLRLGIERFFITDINDPSTAQTAAKEIPILIERPGNHDRNGGNVLFLDGHVEFVDYPGKFPMTAQFVEALESLEDLAR